MVKDLNKLFSCKKIKPIKYSIYEVNCLRANRITSADDWSKSSFVSLKKKFRREHYISQKRRCCYCRRRLNAMGGNEHIDHIVARDTKYRWMFKPKNLVLCCYQCNTQKSNSKTIIDNISMRRLPKKGGNYVVFNPYYHKWGEHFEIEENLFLIPKTTIAENTIKILKLYDYKYSLDYAEEANIFGDDAIKRATKRISSFPKDSIEYESALKVIKEIERHL